MTSRAPRAHAGEARAADIHAHGLMGWLRSAPSKVQSDEVARNEEIYVERARGRHTFECNGRRASRGKGSRTSVRDDRSLLRAAGRADVQPMAPVNTKPRDILQGIPDIVPFSLENAEKGSRVLVTYELHTPSDGLVLPVSDYIDVLKAERDWELANKHFWCSPRAREIIAGLLDGTLGSYQTNFDEPKRQMLDEVGLQFLS
ncbi:hypothetical protein DFH11DRAFT_1728324 [Phellopilus nigrolimitatus]|nr:hypothetical protein DFH11DRAFT_1728324 [Phellopilus nigrolimitatus]